MASVSLKAIIERMKLDNLTPDLDISKIRITQPDINRPALQLAGYFEHFEATRLQIIGFVEYTYMERQAKKEWLMYQDDVYSTMELEEIISRALSQLPENLRQVFEMNRFDGLTYAQIAEKQNISVKTVESYMSKSLKMMRTELKDYLPLILLFCW